MDRRYIAEAVRRVRRTKDLSQRELAEAAGVSQTTIAGAETGRLAMKVDTLARILAVGGCILAIVDLTMHPAEEIWPWNSNGLRDRSGRLFPAHLDVREVGPDGEGWWGTTRLLDHGRQRPTHTFNADRRVRNVWRETFPDEV